MTIATPGILAIDLGKFNSVLCWFDLSTKATAFRTVPTTPGKPREALLRQPGVTVVIEACSPAGWVRNLCGELGLPVVAAGTNGGAWAWKNVKRKTDRDDALKLARLASVGEVQAVPVPAEPVRQRKSLIGLRKRFVGERVRGRNRIRGLLVGQGLPAPRGAKAWTELGLAGLAELAKPLAECGADELWRGELDLLIARYRGAVGQITAIERTPDALGAKDEATALLGTVPGVGPRTAEVIAAYLGDAKRFGTAGEVSSYAGLVPRQYQSGETDRRGRITKRGPKLLRSALVECAWCSLRSDVWARGVWERLQANGAVEEEGGGGVGAEAPGAVPGHAEAERPVDGPDGACTGSRGGVTRGTRQARARESDGAASEPSVSH